MKTFLVFLLVLTTCAFSNAQQQQVKRIEQKLLTKELETFRGLDLKKAEIRQLARQFNSLENNQLIKGVVVEQSSVNKLARFSETMSSLANKHDIKASLRIETIPNEGATIKYQNITERLNGDQPHTLGQLSHLSTSILVGVYYIWSERNGIPTSNRNAFFTIIDDQKIQLPEN